MTDHRCRGAFSRTNITELPPCCRVTIARNDPRFPARGATCVCVRERERESIRALPKGLSNVARVYRCFLSLHHTRRPFERPAHRTVYQCFYHVLPLAHTHDLSISRFVTSITGQAIEPYERQVDYARSTIYNRDRYPASCAHIGK